jgi:hypothetical protein
MLDKVAIQSGRRVSNAYIIHSKIYLLIGESHATLCVIAAGSDRLDAPILCVLSECTEESTLQLVIDEVLHLIIRDNFTDDLFILVATVYFYCAVHCISIGDGVIIYNLYCINTVVIDNITITWADYVLASELFKGCPVNKFIIDILHPNGILVIVMLVTRTTT